MASSVQHAVVVVLVQAKIDTDAVPKAKQELEFRVVATLDEFDQVIRSLAPRVEGLGLEVVMVQVKTATPDGGVRELMVRMSRLPGLI